MIQTVLTLTDQRWEMSALPSRIIKLFKNREEKVQILSNYSYHLFSKVWFDSKLVLFTLIVKLFDAFNFLLHGQKVVPCHHKESTMHGNEILVWLNRFFKNSVWTFCLDVFCFCSSILWMWSCFLGFGFGILPINLRPQTMFGSMWSQLNVDDQRFLRECRWCCLIKEPSCIRQDGVILLWLAIS